MTTNVRRALAVLIMPSKVLALIALCQLVITRMTNNPDFPNAAQMLADFAATLAVLVTAQQAAEGRGKGTAKARNDAVLTVKKGLHQLVAMVQATADADPDRALTIITGAGMSVKRVTPRQKQTLEATQGDASGHVDLTAPVVDGTFSYQWQWSLDQRSWTNMPLAMVSTTSIQGLTPGTMYYFRYQYLTKGGWSDWSQVVSLLVR